jgi:hypothetical protein
MAHTIRDNLPSSLIFGALYHVYGALAAFGWGAALSPIAVGLLVGVRRRAKTLVPVRVSMLMAGK